MSFKDASTRFMDAFGEEGMVVRPVGVKLIPKGKGVPEGAKAAEQGMPWCEAVRIAAMKDEAVVITKDNVGCPAAGIALGLVDQYQNEPLSGKRKYTDLMAVQASPADFTNGLVYACKDSGNMQFALFGGDDTGRYETLGAALRAVSGMTAIQGYNFRAGNLLGLGMPFSIFQQMVTGMEKSAEGFPYKAYPE